MTRYRPPVPHTPPPTSLRGVDLCNSIEAAAALKLHWHLKDVQGVIHEIGAVDSIDATGGKSKSEYYAYALCGLLAHFEDTTADATCLWCIAGTQR